MDTLSKNNFCIRSWLTRIMHSLHSCIILVNHELMQKCFLDNVSILVLKYYNIIVFPKVRFCLRTILFPKILFPNCRLQRNIMCVITSMTMKHNCALCSVLEMILLPLPSWKHVLKRYSSEWLQRCWNSMITRLGLWSFAKSTHLTTYHKSLFYKLVRMATKQWPLQRILM